jgi:hypothetical protein
MDGANLVFGPARLKAFLLAFICIAGGILAIKGSQPQFDVCIAMQPCALRPLMAYLGGILLIICGPLLLWQAIKGVPLLILSESGVVLRTIRGERRVGWQSLGAFRNVQIRRAKYIEATVTGPDADEKTLQQKKLSIMPGMLAGKGKHFVDDLNRYRYQALANMGVPGMRELSGAGIFGNSAQSEWLPANSKSPPAPPGTLRGAGVVLLWCWISVVGWFLFLVAVFVIKDSILHLRNNLPHPDAVLTFSLAASALISGWHLGHKLRLSATSFIIGALLFLLTILVIIAPLHTDNRRALGALVLFGFVPVIMVAGLIAARQFAKFKR